MNKYLPQTYMHAGMRASAHEVIVKSIKEILKKLMTTALLMRAHMLAEPFFFKTTFGSLISDHLRPIYRRIHG